MWCSLRKRFGTYCVWKYRVGKRIRCRCCYQKLWFMYSLRIPTFFSERTFDRDSFPHLYSFKIIFVCLFSVSLGKPPVTRWKSLKEGQRQNNYTESSSEDKRMELFGETLANSNADARPVCLFDTSAPSTCCAALSHSCVVPDHQDTFALLRDLLSNSTYQTDWRDCKDTNCSSKIKKHTEDTDASLCVNPTMPLHRKCLSVCLLHANSIFTSQWERALVISYDI